MSTGVWHSLDMVAHSPWATFEPLQLLNMWLLFLKQLMEASGLWPG